MDILYVLGKGSKWENNELRYSLRSLEKFGRNIDRIYVCGFNPGFLSNEVRFIPCDDPYSAKHLNIQNKIEKVIKETQIGEDFLLSSDDHFYIKETDFDKYPYYYKGFLPDKPKSDNGYDKSLYNTKVVLTALGLNCMETNPHANTHFRKSVFNELADVRKASYLLPNGLEINCIMGNKLASMGVEFKFIVDNKIKYASGDKEIESILSTRHVFSISDTSIQCGIGDYLKNKFPKKCKWEK